jgi:phosphate starvation-inducible PhoH-like protein
MGKQKQRLPEKQSNLVKDFKPITPKQKELLDLISSKEVVMVSGVPGSGKTFCALGAALQMLGEVYKKIVLIKSVTTIPGEAIGFVPGSSEDKMEAFMISYTANIDKICGKGASIDLIKKGLVEIQPLAYIRGVTIDNSIVLIDELQNLTPHLFRTIVSRIGESSKYIFLGDVEQIDRRNKSESCMEQLLKIFKDSPIVGTINFEDSDCVRNPIIPEILQILRANSM